MWFYKFHLLLFRSNNFSFFIVVNLLLIFIIFLFFHFYEDALTVNKNKFKIFYFIYDELLVGWNALGKWKSVDIYNGQRESGRVDDEAVCHQQQHGIYQWYGLEVTTRSSFTTSQLEFKTANMSYKIRKRCHRILIKHHVINIKWCSVLSREPVSFMSR